MERVLYNWALKIGTYPEMPSDLAEVIKALPENHGEEFLEALAELETTFPALAAELGTGAGEPDQEH